MPTYEYRREDGSTFELRQGINDDPLEKCPETGQNVKRMVSGGAGVIYKGEGWYVTDYKNSNTQPVNGSQSTPESNAGLKPDSSNGEPEVTTSEKK